MTGGLYAFIDESGIRAFTPASGNYFLMSAILLADEARKDVGPFLAKLRKDLRRDATHVLHWRNLKSHSLKLHAAQEIGRNASLSVCTVVVCKRDFAPGDHWPAGDGTYLNTLSFLLERLSRFAETSNLLLSYTLSHIIHFKIKKLRDYESALRRNPHLSIAWDALHPAGGRINSPKNLEELQLADLVASATAEAFEPDDFGNVERRYLMELAPRLLRDGYGAMRLWPFNDQVLASHSWLSEL